MQDIDTVVFDIRNVLIPWDPRWLSSTLLLYTARTTTMPVKVYSAVLDGEFGIAAALSTLLLVSSGLCVYGVLHFSQSKQDAFV